MSSKITSDNVTSLGKYLITGLKEKEACTLVGIPHEDLVALKERDQSVRDFIEKQIVQFKYNHLNTIQKTKSEKSSQWLLEKILSEEFGNSKKSNQGQTFNIITQIINDIQDDKKPIVKYQEAEVVEETHKVYSGQGKRIQNLLN